MLDVKENFRNFLQEINTIETFTGFSEKVFLYKKEGFWIIKKSMIDKNNTFSNQLKLCHSVTINIVYFIFKS